MDVLTAISGVSFDEAWDTRATGDLDGIPVHFLGRQALIVSERTSGRLKDLADVERQEGRDGE